MRAERFNSLPLPHTHTHTTALGSTQPISSQQRTSSHVSTAQQRTAHITAQQHTAPHSSATHSSAHTLPHTEAYNARSATHAGVDDPLAWHAMEDQRARVCNACSRRWCCCCCCCCPCVREAALTRAWPTASSPSTASPPHPPAGSHPPRHVDTTTRCCSSCSQRDTPRDHYRRSTCRRGGVRLARCGSRVGVGRR